MPEEQTFTGTLKAAKVARRRRRGVRCSVALAAPGFRVTTAPGSSPSCLVRDADQGGVHDRRVVVKDVLHLDAVDVLAAADQHVLGPVDDEAEAFLVQPRQVAGLHPAVDEGLGRGFRLVPILPHHLVGPLHQSSPTSPIGSSRSPSTVMIFRSVTGTAGPQESGRF